MDKLISYLTDFWNNDYLPLKAAYQNAESERLRYREMCQRQHKKIKRLENKIEKLEVKENE